MKTPEELAEEYADKHECAAKMLAPSSTAIEE